MDNNFLPTIWPEDKLPLVAKDYIQCEPCSSKSRIIWGEGNPKAAIYIILDNPGARENKEGIEYICGTRITLQETLNKVNINSNSVYLTYLLKCRPLRSYDKKKAREFSIAFLEKQIKDANPKCIVCLGDVVLQSMLNNDDVHVRDLRGKWHNIMGFPAIVSYHPLAVRRRPNLKKNFIADLKMLAESFLTSDILSE